MKRDGKEGGKEGETDRRREGNTLHEVRQAVGIFI